MYKMIEDQAKIIKQNDIISKKKKWIDKLSISKMMTPRTKLQAKLW